MTLTGTYVPSKSEWVRDHVEAYEASDGAAPGLDLDGYRIVVITSVGAKSGNLRKNPVMRVERDGTYVAIASKGGAEDNPEWYHNFLANPLVELQDGADRADYTVRLAQGEERADWWAHAVATWPTYADYQLKTDREIPVFLLERA